MKVPKKLSDLLFAIFIILFGLTKFGLGSSIMNLIIGGLAVVIGVLKFLGK